MSTPQPDNTPKMTKEKNHKPKKNGRPAKSEEEKKKPTTVWLTGAERAELDSRRGKLPLSLYIHHQAMDGKVIEPISKDIAISLRAMIGIGNNINQFARYAHEHRSVLPVLSQLDYEGKLLANLLIVLADKCSQR